MVYKQEIVRLVSDVLLIGANNSEQMPDTVYYDLQPTLENLKPSNDCF